MRFALGACARFETGAAAWRAALEVDGVGTGVGAEAVALAASRGRGRGPDLVVVAGAAGPDLELVAVDGVAVGEVETESLAGEGNPVVVGVVPSLLRKTRVALPDLDL
jgi:hypothetical protein